MPLDLVSDAANLGTDLQAPRRQDGLFQNDLIGSGTNTASRKTNFLVDASR
jgi:hypothetical protein